MKQMKQFTRAVISIFVFVFLLSATVFLILLSRGDKVDRLIEHLSDPNPDVREVATYLLGESKDPRAVEPLLNTLDREANITIRETCVYALGQLKAEKAIEPLLLCIFIYSPNIHRLAEEALGKIGEPAVEPLINALTNRKYLGIQYDIIEVLIEIGEPSVVPLLKFLDNKDYSLRDYATWALGEIGDKRALVPLVKMLNDKEAIVRYTAVLALVDMRDKKAFEPLIKALSDEDSKVRRAAVIELGRIGDKRALEPLKTAIQKEQDVDVLVYMKEAIRQLSAPPPAEKK